MKRNRWFYAAVGVILMLFAGLIYAWSVLSRPLAEYFTEWTSAQLSFTFTICMTFFCLGGVLAGFLSGRINAKFNLAASALLFLAGFFIAANTSSLAGLYIGYGILAGTGSGVAYNTVMGTVTKYFPDKPGLISGILLMGFGIGSFIIGKVYQAYTGPGEGWRTSFEIFGILLFVVMILCSFLLKAPKEKEDSCESGEEAAAVEASGRETSGIEVIEMEPAAMLKRSSFWLYFIWAVLLCAAGLAVISQAGGMVLEVSPDISAGTVSTVVGLISVFNGIGRVLFGGLFDKIGRVKTMVFNEILFCAALGLLILSLMTGILPALVAGFMIMGLAYGGVPTTNSAFVGAFYGKKNYSVNFSLLNLNLIFSSFGSTIAGLLYDTSGSYFSTLIAMLGAVIVGIVIAVMIKKP
ncbi:MFS transporter [Lacrimispora sp.]|uniref:MFS transporter n=1 Tax=Lacrimispora sp. TaxID=2719234 RepID=UPI0028A87FC8|nr:MFS transporter [Lacrimispora sp.]